MTKDFCDLCGKEILDRRAGYPENYDRFVITSSAPERDEVDPPLVRTTEACRECVVNPANWIKFVFG